MNGKAVNTRLTSPRARLCASSNSTTADFLGRVFKSGEGSLFLLLGTVHSPLDAQTLSRSLIDDVVVRHEHNVGALDTHVSG
jgi:hypothetical protein